MHVPRLILQLLTDMFLQVAVALFVFGRLGNYFSSLALVYTCKPQCPFSRQRDTCRLIMTQKTMPGVIQQSRPELYAEKACAVGKKN